MLSVLFSSNFVIIDDMLTQIKRQNHENIDFFSGFCIIEGNPLLAAGSEAITK